MDQLLSPKKSWKQVAQSQKHVTVKEKDYLKEQVWIRLEDLWGATSNPNIETPKFTILGLCLIFPQYFLGLFHSVY